MSDVGELDHPGTPGSLDPWDARSEEWLVGTWERHVDGAAKPSVRGDGVVPGGEDEADAEGRGESSATEGARGAQWEALDGSRAEGRMESTAAQRASRTADAASHGPAERAGRTRRSSARRGAIDPVKTLMHRHRDLCERAVDPLEIAAGLEAHGLTDRTAARFRHRDVFSLAEEMYARMPRDGDRPPPRPTAADTPREHWVWAVLALLPGTLCTVTVIGLRHSEGRLRLAVAAFGALAVAFGLRAALARGPLRAPARATTTALRVWTCWLLAYALLGDGLLRAALDGGPDSPWRPATTPVVALALACGPAAWCAHHFSLRARRRLAAARGLEEFASSVTPLLLGVFGLFLCALGALLALCGALLGEPAEYAGAGALGTLLLLARLLTAHGSGRAPAVVLGTAAAAEAMAPATVFAGRLPGCSFIATPVQTLADAWGTDAVPALVCAPAALILLAHAVRTLTRASAHARPPGSP
jgi:hypothetical protein